MLGYNVECVPTRDILQPTFLKQRDISCSLMQGAYYINDFCIRIVYRGVPTFTPFLARDRLCYQV